MTLAALIQKGGLERLANANPAKAANHQQHQPGTLARLATLALANPARPDAFPTVATAASISEWYQERRAIMEFDGGLTPDEANLQAWARTLSRFGLPDNYRLH